MEVKLIREYSGMYEGTVLKDARLIPEQGCSYYEGLYCSRAGSYHVEVPAAYCVYYDSEFERKKLYAGLKKFFDKEDQRLGYII